MSLHERIATFEADPPQWQGPPLSLLPGVAAIERTLVEAGSIAIRLELMLVYPTGAELIFEITDHDTDARDPTASVAHEILANAGKGLRVEVEYADGRHATGALPPDHCPDGVPVLALQRVEGWPAAEEVRYWLSPLPPPGPVIVAVKWPRRGIARASVQLEQGLFRCARRGRSG